MKSAYKEVIIYTDGACEPNPGPGGYGVVLIYGKQRKEISGGFKRSTNNRMEIYAAIKGLEVLKSPCKVTLFSDSEYLVNAMKPGWVQRWKEKNWWRNKNEKAANVDLWERLLHLCSLHQVDFIWVKAHSGVPDNERCDELSILSLKQDNLPIDDGYSPTTEMNLFPKGKITQEGEPCRKCFTPVIRKIPFHKSKQNQSYYYEYYLVCPKCQTIYFLEEAKRYYK